MSNQFIPPPPPAPRLVPMHAQSNERSEKRAAAGFKAYNDEMTRTNNVALAIAAQQAAYEKFNKNNPAGGRRKTHR